MQLADLEAENDQLVESERQTAAELTQRLEDMQAKSQVAAQQLVAQKLLQVRLLQTLMRKVKSRAWGLRIPKALGLWCPFVCLLRFLCI